MDKESRKAYILEQLAAIGIKVTPLDPSEAAGKNWHISSWDNLGRIVIESKYPPCASSDECRRKFDAISTDKSQRY
jgi:hypothetical protein